MKDFKFLRGTVGDSDLMNTETYSTASFPDTPEGHMGRRMLYYRNTQEYNGQQELTRRINGGYRNNPVNEIIETEEPSEFELDPMLRAHQETNTDRIKNLILKYEEQDKESRQNYISFFTGVSRMTKLNPKWWMKIKMFYQKIKYNSVIETSSEALGIFLTATFITLGVTLIIAKILNIL